MGSFFDFVSRATQLAIPVSGLRRKFRDQQDRIHKRMGLRVRGQKWETKAPESAGYTVAPTPLSITKGSRVGSADRPSYKV